MAKFPAANTRTLVRRYGTALAAIVFVTVLPLIFLFTAGFVASVNDCALDEGGAHPCLVLGSDVGQILYNMVVGGWLMIFTLPIGAGLFVLWLLVLVVHSWRRRKRPSFDRTG